MIQIVLDRLRLKSATLALDTRTRNYFEEYFENPSHDKLYKATDAYIELRKETIKEYLKETDLWENSSIAAYGDFLNGNFDAEVTSSLPNHMSITQFNAHNHLLKVFIKRDTQEILAVLEIDNEIYHGNVRNTEAYKALDEEVTILGKTYSGLEILSEIDEPAFLAAIKPLFPKYEFL